MSKWEDIVKDKLGGYESNLPEDSLAAFHARRATAGATKAKRFPFVWALVPAIAAGLAAILLLRKPTVPEDGIQMIPQPVETYSQVDDSLDTATPPATAPLIAQATRTNVVRPARETAQPAATTVVEENHIPEETRIPEETPVPETDDIGLTTGLEYSLYSSSFRYPTGGKTQLVHYLGIPVRLDWTFASSRWIDAYLGAGVKGDLCMGATLDGEALGKDGPAFRLLGAGGIQFNATRHLSLFVEPEISWALPSERRVLSTYSSEHPWMFTVATGVRINLGK